MPLEDPDLTEQQALDIADLVNAYDRPKFRLAEHLPTKEDQEPSTPNPIDQRFLTYSPKTARSAVNRFGRAGLLAPRIVDEEVQIPPTVALAPW